jgi:uncharacterized protein YjbJ (UPF0337 family)
MDLNKEKLKGTLNVSVGSLREGVGEASGDKDMRDEGAAQKARGRLQKLAGAIKDGIKQGKALLKIKTKYE